MNKKTFLIVVLLLSLLLKAGFSSAACTSYNTPRIKQVNYFELAEDALFEYDFDLSNMPEKDVSYTYAFLDKQLTGITLDDNGTLKFKPSNDDIGVAKIALIAVKESCAYTLVITFRIFDRPDIKFFEPLNSSFRINQTQSVMLRARAEDTDINDSLTYEWLLNSELINDSVNKTKIVFRPGFGLAGVHDVSVKVTDSHNLSTTKTWYIQISRVNRPPVLLYEVPSFVVFKNTETGAYNLNDYFSDPEKGLLRFEYRPIRPAYDLRWVAYANISVTIDETGFITYNPVLNTLGNAYFVFTAYDILNRSAESNIVKVDVMSSDQFKNLRETSTKDYCGDYVCSLVEDCHTCPFDCGLCEEEEQVGCKPEWNCTEWTPCMPAGFMTRECIDLNDCKDNRTKPDDVRQCEYNATCDDGLKNGIEEGVDCGGPCDPCPTCNDSIQNQGEDDVDCGGPCDEPCPTCFDMIKNQEEGDVDCGGPCEKRCGGNKSCLKNMDCESLRCEYLVCTFPTCNDGIRNQGEESIDCEGPCEKRCGNCSDGIQNRGEEGVDCGGLCRPCPDCNDGIKNGDEWLMDCGGSKCSTCGFKDYFQAFRILFFIVIIIIGVIPVSFISYFFFLLTHPEKARRLYENNTGFAFLVRMNKLLRKPRHLRKKKLVISKETIKKFVDELTELGNRTDIKDKELYEHIIRIYTALLGLPGEFDDSIFALKLKTSNIPFFMKILFAGFYKKAEVLAMNTFVAPEQKQDMIVELKFLLAEAGKG